MAAYSECCYLKHVHTSIHREQAPRAACLGGQFIKLLHTWTIKAEYLRTSMKNQLKPKEKRLR